MSKPLPSNITRIDFYLHVIERNHLSTPHHHVQSVVAIALDELMIDLKRGVSYTIGNFGTLVLRQMGSRQHRNVVTGEVVVSEGYRSLRFDIDRKFRQFLLDWLDIDKTFATAYDKPIATTPNELKGQ